MNTYSDTQISDAWATLFEASPELKSRLRLPLKRQNVYYLDDYRRKLNQAADDERLR